MTGRIRSAAKTVTGVKTRRSKSSRGVPVGCKGPCKTHTLDVIRTIHHDGRGAGHISNIEKGDGFGEREGRKVRISRMLIRGKLWLDAAHAVKPHCNVVKMWLIKDRRPGNELVGFGSLFDMTDNEPLSGLIKMDYRDRFLVIKDFTYDLYGGANFRADIIDIDEMIELNSD